MPEPREEMMEERTDQETEPEAQEAQDTSLAGRPFRGVHAIAVIIAAFIVMLAAIWRCG